MDTDGLSIICGGLGSVEEDDDGNVQFVKGEFCLDNLKDLLRFLRRDDPTTRDVFKQVCKWNIVSNSLIPIFEYCQDDRNLVLNAVKVLVFLTMPLEGTSKDFNEQLEYLWSIKLAITLSNVVAVIVSLLEKPLENLECKAFSEDDWKLVQLVLTLFRNILAVQEISAYQTTLGSANQYLTLRDDFLDLLFRENVMDLIIIITQHVGGSCRYLRHDNLLLLEIYHHILKGQDAELIAKVCQDKSKVDEEAKPCLESLKCIMQEETEKRKYIRLHASRHSTFNGAFTRLTLDGSKTMCKGMPSSATCDKLLKPEKAHRGASKKIVKDYAQLPTTKRSILEKLHDFLNQFLTGGYNVLMQSIAQDIEKEHHAIQTSDVQMFFHLAQFVTYFQYHKSQLIKSNEGVNNTSSISDDDDDDDSMWFKGDMCGPIAATMNDSMFALVIAKWQLAFEGLKETKNNAFLSVAGSLLKTMIRMLDLVLKMMPEKSKEPQTARSILYKLFYDQTDQGLTHFLLNMFRSFDAHKQPKSDLADLVEIIHVVIRLMEKLQAHGTLRVARKARKAKRKKDLKNKENKTSGDDAIVQNDTLPAGSEDLPGKCYKERSTQAECGEKEESQVDERQTSGVNLEGDHEKSNQIHDPLGDGSNQIHGESNQIHGESSHVHEALGIHGESTEINENIAVTGADDCNSSADEELPATDEVDFKMTPLLSSLANSTIISNLCWLLKFYKSNSIATNHYILCLLRRISDDLDLAPMLYQLSLLVIFYDILNEQKACPRKEYENIVQFLTSLVRRMLRKMKEQPLLFVDVLFWKSRKDCHYINVESIQREVGEMRKEVRKWGNADDSGAPHGKESTYNRKSLADALGDDEYDVIIPNQNNLEKDEDSDEAAGEVHHTSGFEENKSRKENPLEGDPQVVIKKKRRLIRSDKLEEEIIGLYEKYKDDLNCTQLIAQALDPEGNISSAQVSRKCKKLGLQLLSKRNSSKTSVTVDNDQNKEGKLETDSTVQDLNHADGPSDIGRPMQARKRVRAIDETQELKIRSLFEQFKDHKRCSHMIAKELDSDVAVTAAQVSRKLKKLGLRTSRMKSEVKGHNLDEGSTDEEDDDNLTLSLVRKRRKSKEDASSYKEMGNSKSVQSQGSISDDELILSSILKKSRTAQTEAPESEDKLADALIDQDSAGEGSDNLNGQSLEERGEREAKNVDVDVQRLNSPHSRSPDQADGSGDWGERGNQHINDELSVSSDDASDYGSPDSGPEDNATTDMNVSVDTAQDKLKYSELEDSGDEQAPNVSPESSAKRRKIRIVMDFDDDE